MKIERWMEKKGVTYRSMAKELGVSHSLLFYCVQGKRKMSLKLAVKIEKITKGEVRCKDLVQ